MKRKEMIVAIKEALKDRNRVSRRIPIECKKETVQNWAIYFNNEKSFFVLRDRDTDKDFFEPDITIKGLQALAEALGVFLPKEEEAPEIEPTSEKTFDIGRKLIYNKQEVTIIDSDLTHVLIKFKDGTKIATPKAGFKK